MFIGDERVTIASMVSDNYEGLLHSILMEYFPKLNITLCYFLNAESSDIYNKLFAINANWFESKAISLSMDDRSNPIEKDLYIAKRENSESEKYYITSQDTGSKLFNNLESILNYRTIIKEFDVYDRYGLTVHKTRTLKKYSIRIDRGDSSSTVDFDSLDELKDLLISTYHAKYLVPISYTPWDTTDAHVKLARKIEDLTILYLYYYKTFETRTI